VTRAFKQPRRMIAATAAVISVVAVAGVLYEFERPPALTDRRRTPLRQTGLPEGLWSISAAGGAQGRGGLDRRGRLGRVDRAAVLEMRQPFQPVG